MKATSKGCVKGCKGAPVSAKGAPKVGGKADKAAGGMPRGMMNTGSPGTSATKVPANPKTSARAAAPKSNGYGINTGSSPQLPYMQPTPSVKKKK